MGKKLMKLKKLSGWERRMAFAKAVEQEVDRAVTKHGDDQWGRHEFYAILLEEVDEVWDDVKHNAPQDQLMKEIVQVAAVCMRYAETLDRYREPIS